MGRRKNLQKRFATGQAAARAGVHIPSERGMTMRPGRGTPLPPKGVASGPTPTITGVVAQGDRTVIVSGKGLTGVHFYVEGAAAGPDAKLVKEMGQSGRRAMWVQHGPMHWDGRDISITPGSYNLWIVASRTDSKIVLDLVEPAVGKVTISGFAQDKAYGQSGEWADHDVHWGSGDVGKPISTPGFPKTIQFGGVKGAATKPSRPSRPSKPKGRIGRRRRR